MWWKANFHTNEGPHYEINWEEVKKVITQKTKK